MNTLLTTTEASRPVHGEPVNPGEFSYWRTRNRMHVFELVLKEFEKSDLSQVELATRMGKGADRICRLLGAPGNWTLDTVSDLLYAISAAEVKYDVAYPLDKPKRNLTRPEWLLRVLSPATQIVEDEEYELLIPKKPASTPVPQSQTDLLDQLRAM